MAEDFPNDRIGARWLRALGGAVGLIALTDILGWVLHARALEAFPPGAAPMVMNTAACLLLCGLGLIALSFGYPRVARACGAVVALFCALILAQFFLGRSFGADQLVWHRSAAASYAAPGRTTPNTAVALIFVGISLLLPATEVGRRWLQPAIGGLVVAFALLPFLNYLSLILTGGDWTRLQGMSLLTSVSLALLAIAILRRAGPGGTEAKSLPLLAAALGMLVSIGVVLEQSNVDLITANRWVTHTYEVRGDIDYMVSEVARMESSDRAYALTGFESFRTRDAYHRGEIIRQLDGLKQLVQDSPAQEHRVELLQGLARQKFSLGDAVLRAREQGGAAAAAAVVMEQPTAVTSMLVTVSDEMKAAETEALAARIKARTNVEANARTMAVLGSVLALALVVGAILIARRAAAARRKAEANLQGVNARLAQRVGDLAMSEERFRHAFDFAGSGMALVALNGAWLRVNRALCEVTGYSEAELQQKTFQELTHPDDLAKDLASVRELLTGQRRYYQLEKRYFHRDGHVVWIRLTVSLIRDAAGQPLHFVTQVEDITESKRLQEDLARARDEAVAASRFKSEFLATVSHEIRTPMNGIIGMAELLMGTKMDDDQREMGRVIQSSAESLMHIINDVLDFSKVEAGKLRLDPVNFELREVIDDALALLAPRAEEKGLDLSCDFDAPLDAPMLGDAGRIRQVVVNLVGNAVKFTAAGRIDVAVRHRGDVGLRRKFRVEVRDTGIGIPPADQGRLFQAFTQVDGSTTRRFGGTGLGLAICRQLVHLMAGEIGFESVVGRGSTFWFELELPITRTAMMRPAASDGVEPATAGRRGLRLLVAEDNATNQLVTRRLLAKMGHEVDIVDNGQLALARLEEEKYDAILMDCQMPVIDGYEVTRRIRAGKVPRLDPLTLIIAITASATPEDRRRCFEAGMNDYVAKPIRANELNAALRRVGLAMPEPAG